MVKKLKFGVYAPSEESRNAIINACVLNKVDSVYIDILGDGWFEDCDKLGIDGFLIHPPCNYEEHKQIIDERVYILNTFMSKPTYPSLEEILVYENKRNMSSWCKIFNLPSAKTHVFTTLNDAKQFLINSKYPLVSKSNVGAGGTSVRIIKEKRTALKIAKKIFGRFHPEFSFGYFPMGNKGNIPFPRIGRSQRHYMICQDFLSIKWEWRIIRIGESYFGHKKLLGDNGKASGSLLVGWDKPPFELLEIVKCFTEKTGFRTVALDFFETENNEYFVNEIQPLIGAYAPSQMYIDEVPGRYVFKNANFVFEQGEFCKNKCWDLRVEDFKKIINNGDSQ